MWNVTNQTQSVAAHSGLRKHSDEDVSVVHLPHLPGRVHVKKHSESKIIYS